MTDTFMTPDDDGPIKASDFTTSPVEQLGARAAEAFHDLPVPSLVRAARQAHAGGEDLAVGAGGEVDAFGNVPLQQQQEVIDRQKAAIPDISKDDAKALLKQEGLSESDVPLGTADSHKLPVLKLRIEDAHAQRDREAAIERGPQGLFPTALGFVTSLGVGMVDPINLAAFSIPVLGEARMGKILASAGDSMLGRAAVRAGEGAAKGAVGMTALQPLDWWLHTHDGRDYTMSEAMQSIVMGAGMGAAFHALPQPFKDWYSRSKGLPFKGTDADNRVRESLGEETWRKWRKGKFELGGDALARVMREMPRGAPPEPPGPATAHPEEEVPGISPEAPTAPETAPLARPEEAVPTPGEVLADLPEGVRQDAVHSAMAALIEGKPVQTAEILDIAASHDPRIAETVDPWNAAGAAARAEIPTPQAARQAIADDVRQKLRAAGLSEEEADANAAVTAARYNARAARLGTGQSALDLYRGENLSIRNDGFGFPGEAGRAFAQRRPQQPGLFAEREAEGQASLPGTERIGPGELAQRGADAPLKPGVAQKPLDVGLFGDDAAQKSFFQSQPQVPPFYSALDRAVTSSKQDKATPEQWLGTLKNAAGVKPEEMKWLGLEDWLKQQKGSVTRQQLQDYVRANAIEVKEVAKGRIPLAEMDEVERRAAQTDAAAEAINLRMMNKYGGLSEAFEKWTEAERTEFDRVHGEAAEAGAALSERNQDHADGLTSRGNDAKYSSYVLPGGENYRELLLTLPNKQVDVGKQRLNAIFARREKIQDRFDELHGNEGLEAKKERILLAGEDEDLRRESAQLQVHEQDTIGNGNFRSSHWEEPNVLAHIRFDDRVSDGKKTLHLAEVQSDWHQAGKRKGYQEEIPDSERNALIAERDRLSEQASAVHMDVNKSAGRRSGEEFSRYMSEALYNNPEYVRPMERITEINERLGERGGQVPDAPFKTTWPELSMKRMIRYAAEHGYDRVSWDTGATNAERYDLSKQIKEIEYVKNADGSYRLGIADKEGEPVGALPGMDVNRMTLDQVEQALGKEIAEKIRNEEGKKFRGHDGFTLENVDLKVGGEGMAGFYDRILPATVNKLVKKFGAKVEESRVPTGVDKENRWALRDATDQGEGEIVSTHPTRAEAEREAEDYGGGVEIRELPVDGAQVHSLDLTPELRQAAMQQGFPLFQGGGEAPRGRITLSDNAAIIDLFRGRDASTFMHESGHLWLDELLRDAAHPDAPAPLRADRDAVLNWLGVKDASEIGTAQHEKWAEGFEQYLRSGEAPSSALAKAFEAFKRWIGEIYRALSNAGEPIPREIRGVMDRMLATEGEIADRGDELNASTREVKKTARGRAAADPQTWSLFEYLASKGGLKPDPELHAIFGGKRGPMIGGFGPLLRNDGMPLDEALRVAKEGHYLFDAGDVSGAEANLTPRDLLDMVDRESRGRKVYRMDHVTPDREIAPEEEAKHIVDALHDELEASSGQKGIEIDPKLEARVVEIVRHEGVHDVLVAYERAIMETEEAYNAAADARTKEPRDAAIPGWDVPADAGAAPQGRPTAAADRGPAGRAGSGDGAGAGGEPRAVGAGDRAPGQAELARPQKSTPAQAAADPRWRELSEAKADYDDPETLAESEAAAKLPEPASTEDPKKSLTALEKAAADAEEVWRQLEPTLTEAERTLVTDVMDQLKLDAETRNKIISDGAACLAGAIA